MKTSTKISEEKLRKAFNEADVDKDGQIGVKALKETLSKLGYKVDDKELEGFLKGSGVETSDKINYGMFSSLVQKIASEKEHESELRLAFEEFDGEKKGYIEGTGIKRVLNRLKIEHTSEEIELMMEVADTNGDGRVDIEEFLQIFKPGVFD